MILGLSTKTLSAVGAAAALLVVGITGAVLADGDDFAPVEAPAWKAGYAFAYDVTGEVEYLYQEPGSQPYSDKVSLGPIPIEKEVLSTQFSHAGEPLYVGAATFPIGNLLSDGMDFEFPDLAVYPTADRQRDLGPVGARINDAGDGLAFGPAAPFTYLDFPLEQGKRWDTTVHVAELFGEADAFEGTDYVDMDDVLVQAEVGAMETLDLPLGSVEAVRVDISYTPVGLQKAVAQARADAERFGAEIERLNVQLGIHEIAWYAPEYEAIVQDVFVVRALVDAAGSYDGQHYELYSEATGTARAEMTGARLLKGPERSTEDILRILRGEAPIADAHGQVVPESLYDVSVEGPSHPVNAATAPQVRFETSLEGARALPEGHTMQYRLLDASGRVVDQGPASDSWSLTIDRPGGYTLIVQAVEEGGAVHAQDAMTFVADWHQSIDASCPGYQVNGVNACDDVSLPVLAGIQSASVAAYRNGTDLLGGGTLYVEAPSRTYRGGMDDGAYRVTIDEFEADDLGRRWDAYYGSTFGSGGSVTYVLDLRYGAPQQFAPPPEDAGTGGQLVMQDADSMSAFGAPLGDFLRQLRSGERPVLDADLDTILS